MRSTIFTPEKRPTRSTGSCRNNIRYVLWLQRDNYRKNDRFLPIWNKIRSRYAWRHYAGNDGDWAVGFWERVDPPAAGR